MTEEIELTEAQLHLRDKVLNSGRGITIEQAITRATNVIKAMSADFAITGDRDVERMRDVVGRMERGDGAYDEMTKELFLVSHDVRGTAGTFGYNTASIAANKLCRLIEDNTALFDDGDGKAIEAAKVHSEAIALVLSQKPSDRMGLAENNLLDGLSAIGKKLGAAPD